MLREPRVQPPADCDEDDESEAWNVEIREDAVPSRRAFDHERPKGIHHAREWM